MEVCVAWHDLWNNTHIGCRGIVVNNTQSPLNKYLLSSTLLSLHLPLQLMEPVSQLILEYPIYGIFVSSTRTGKTYWIINVILLSVRFLHARISNPGQSKVQVYHAPYIAILALCG